MSETFVNTFGTSYSVTPFFADSVSRKVVSYAANWVAKKNANIVCT